MKELVESYDYSRAYQLLEAEHHVRDEDQVYDPVAAALLRYALARFELDYESAVGALGGLSPPNLIAQEIERWREEASSPSLGIRIRDIWQGAEICCKQQRWGDFLTRVASFLDSIWRYWAEKEEPRITGAYRDAQGNCANIKDPQGSWYISEQSLKEVLPEFDPGRYSPLSLGRRYQPGRRRGNQDLLEPHRYLYDIILQFLFQSDSSKYHKLQTVGNTCHQFLEPLVRLRNEHLHKLRGISERDIRQAAGCIPSEVLQKLQSVYNTVVDRTPPKTFNRINRTVMSLLHPILG
jgi:hypothetical protein